MSIISILINIISFVYDVLLLMEGKIMRKFLIICFLIILTQNVHAEDKQYIIDDSHLAWGFL